MQKSKRKTRDILIKYIKQNKKEFMSVTIVFFIGILIGIVCINNLKEIQKLEIIEYIKNFITGIKESNSIDTIKLLKSTIAKNLITTLILWFVGLAVISMPIIYLIIAFRGFCLGYAISAVCATLGTWKGAGFVASGIFLQNILFIPSMIAIGVSGIKLYNSIKTKKVSLKSEILRHSFFSIFVLIFIILSSIIEIYVSSALLTQYIKYL